MDSEQLGKSLRNSHIGPACTEPFNYNTSFGNACNYFFAYHVLVIMSFILLNYLKLKQLKKMETNERHTSETVMLDYLECLHLHQILSVSPHQLHSVNGMGQSICYTS